MVPDVSAPMQIKNGELIMDSDRAVLNAYDASAVEEALVLKETTFDQIMQDQFGINTRNKAAFVDAFFDIQNL